MTDFNKPLFDVIDVSHWNGNINWCDVANKFKGVIIKCGGSETGKVYQDKLFEDYYLKAKNHGLHVGVYFFGYGSSTKKGVEDAIAFREMIKDKQFDLPVYLDYESPNTAFDGNDKKCNTDYCKSFCHTLESYNYWVGIYGSDSSTFNSLVNKNDLLDFGWWVAKYSNNAPKYATKNCQLWQYTSSYTFDTMKGVKFDVSHVYIDFPKLIKGVCKNGY